MRVERFYHSAPSSAESTAEPLRAFIASGCDSVLPAHAFPAGLEAAAYALKKRIICPRWWLVGVVSQWLIKDSEQLALQLSLQEDDWVLSGPNVSVKFFPIVVALWTEIFAQLSRSETREERTLEIVLARILRGTAAEIKAQREFITDYLSAALRVQKVRSVATRLSNKSQKNAFSSSSQLVLDAVGLLQVVENVVLKDGFSETLLVTFVRDPARLFSADIEDLLPIAFQKNFSKIQMPSQSMTRLSASIISLQPDVLQALSRAVSPKKLCSYLALELSKSDEKSNDEQSSEERVWRGRALGTKELSKLHKEQLARSQSFYDHGILSWENEAPKQRVRHMVVRSSKQADSGIVHCWRMSQHALDAIQFENALSKVLYREEELVESIEPSGSCPTALPPTKFDSENQSPAIMMISSELSVTSNKSLLDTSTDAIHEPVGMTTIREKITHIFPQKSQSTFSKKGDSWSDDDFLMRVSEFYESLTPLQQQAFERERKKMTLEQFKKYVTPALIRMRKRH